MIKNKKRKGLSYGVFFTVVITFFSLSGCANNLFYFPDQFDYQARYIKPIPHEDVWLKGADKNLLHGWFLPAQGEAKGTILFLHGNAQNLTAHALYMNGLPSVGYNVFIVDYRGYGLSSGKSDRRGVLRDAKTAYDYLRTRKGLDPNKLIIYGQSLGGAIALTLAGQQPLPGLKAVIADSAFSNYARIGREKILQVPVLGYVLWPFSPLIVSGGLSPDKFVAAISPVPVLFIHGSSDAIVPFSHSQRLYQKAKAPKALWELKGAGHTEALGRYRAQLMPYLLPFLEQVLSKESVDITLSSAVISLP